MILSKNFKDFRSENIYNEKINKPNVQLVELIFKKVYDTNTSELEKKTKYRNFFLKPLIHLFHFFSFLLKLTSPRAD